MTPTDETHPLPHDTILDIPPCRAPASPGMAPTAGASASGHDAAPLPNLGRYRLCRKLGQGGMGVVWKAWDPDLSRFVALKQIKWVLRTEDDAVPRLLREARLAARLRHPSLVRVLDVGVVDGLPILAMEYVEGRTFGELLRESGGAKRTGSPIPPERLRAEVEILASAAEGVAHAHREGIIHRDLKPDNILLDLESRALVTDFGLACEGPGGDGHAATRLTRTGQVLGTPAYMSPDQLGGDSQVLRPQVDVWALGVMLYEVLTGRLPFESEDTVRLLASILTADPVPPSRACPACPAELEAVCLAALAKDPAQRYPDAGPFAEELRRWLRGEPVVTPVRGAAERLWRRIRVRQQTAAALVCVLLAASGAGAWGWLARRATLQHGREQLAQIASAVDGLGEAIMTTPMTRESLAELARQPLALVEEILEQDPASGPARAWRGMARDLAGLPGAEADFDLACERAPDDPTVWYLRGTYYAAKFSLARPLPAALLTPGRVIFLPARPESERERSWRERAVADLTRMVALSSQGTTTGPRKLQQLCRAEIALAAGDDAGCEVALAECAGLDHPSAWLILARACQHLRRFDDAVGLCGRVLARWPECAEAFRLRALAGHARGVVREAAGAGGEDDYRAAIVDLDEVLRRAPEWSGALFDRGAVRTRLAGFATKKGADPMAVLAAALDDFDAALAIDPAEPTGYLNRGDARGLRARAQAARGLDPREAWAEAVRDFDQAIVLGLTNGSANCNRADSYLHLGDWQATHGLDPSDAYAKALADLDAAIRSEPGFAFAYDSRGEVRSALAEWGESRGNDPRAQLRGAIADHEEALRRDPGLHLAHLNLSARLRALGQAEAARGLDPRGSWRQAIAACGEAVARGYEPAEARDRRGTARTLLAAAESDRGEDPRGLLREAIEDFGAALVLNPSQFGTWSNRGNAWRKLGQADGARGADPRESLRKSIADLGESLRLNPGSAAVYVNRGVALASLGEANEGRGADPRESFRLAIRDYGSALALSPGNPVACSNRSAGWLRLGRAEFALGADPRDSFRSALADAEQALAANPRYGSALANAGWALVELGQAEARRNTDPCGGYLRALRRFDEASGENPRLGDARKGRGRAWRLLGELAWDGRATTPAAAVGAFLHAHLEAARAASSMAAADPEAGSGLRDFAFACLARAIDLGMTDSDWLETEPTLAGLRADPRWPEVLARAK